MNIYDKLLYDSTHHGGGGGSSDTEKKILFSDMDDGHFREVTFSGFTDDMPKFPYFDSVASSSGEFRYVTKICLDASISKIPVGFMLLSSSFASDLNTIEIKGSISEIGRNAFRYCHGLVHIYFRSSVDRINKGAFFDCGNILEYDFSNCTAIPELETGFQDSHLGHDSGCVIKVPQALLNEWKSASIWSSLPTDPEVEGYVVWEGV